MIGVRQVQAGGILGFSGRSFGSTIINLATYGIPRWSISHVGIVAPGPDGGRLMLYESLYHSDEPCEVTGVTSGTQAHSIESAIERADCPVWYYPYYRRLYQFERRRISEYLLSSIGLPYDYIGAFRSAGLGLSWIESLLREEDLSAIFCSEWVASAYADAGLFAINHASRWNPNRLLRHLRRARVLHKPERVK